MRLYLLAAAVLVSSGCSTMHLRQPNTCQECAACQQSQAEMQAAQYAAVPYDAVQPAQYVEPAAATQQAVALVPDGAGGMVQLVGHGAYGGYGPPGYCPTGDCGPYGPCGHGGKHPGGGRYGWHGAAHRTPGYPMLHHHHHREYVGPQGPPTAQVAYPYYTTRGPRDFLLDNPPSIGR